MGVVLSTNGEGVVESESSDGFSIDVPDGCFGCPVNGVVVEGVNGCSHGWVFGTVIGGSVSLSEEIVLNLSVVETEPFPINLIQIIGFENETTDDSGSW